MKNKVQRLKGYGIRLGKIDVFLKAEGFYLPWSEKEIDHFFRYAKKGKNSVPWRDQDGNVVIIIFAMEVVQEDIYNSKLTVINADYFTIDVISRSIKKFLHEKG